MKEKESPKRIIESEKKPKFEKAYVKFPRHKPVDVSEKRERSSVWSSEEKMKSLQLEHGGQSYTHIHTHPHKSILGNILDYISSFFIETNRKQDDYDRKEILNRIKKEKGETYIPSSQDIKHFLFFSQEKSMVIAGQEEHNGKLIGYFILKKTKDTPRNIDTREVDPILEDYHLFSVSQKKFAIRKIADKYHLQYREIDAKGVTIDKYNRPRSLEKRVIASIIVILSLFLSLFFLSANLTGNVIGNLTKTSSNWIGVLILGLVGVVIYFKDISSVK